MLVQMLNRKLILEIFRDRYFQPYFPSRIEYRDGPEWAIAGVGYLTDEEIADLVLVAHPPSRALAAPNWWQRIFNTFVVPADEQEMQARHHIWLIRQQCLSVVAMRHEIMKRRFTGVGLLEKLLKETR